MDIGRLVMIPFALFLLIFNVADRIHQPGSGLTGMLHWLGTAEAVGFYALLIAAYLRRGQAIASSRSVSTNVCAIAGNLLPFAFLALAPAQANPGRELASGLLLLAAFAAEAWSLLALGRNLSVIPQARNVVEHGPYRWVRHPLYLAEMIGVTGVAVGAWSLAAVVLWLVTCAIQSYRAYREEQVLLSALPGYRAYRSRTAILLPGIF